MRAKTWAVSSFDEMAPARQDGPAPAQQRQSERVVIVRRGRPGGDGAPEAKHRFGRLAPLEGDPAEHSLRVGAKRFFEAVERPQQPFP